MFGELRLSRHFTEKRMVRSTLWVTPLVQASKGKVRLWVSGDTKDYHVELDAIITSWRVGFSCVLVLR